MAAILPARGWIRTVRTKQEQAFEALRRAIEQGEIAPGERLNIRQLARTLGMSEIPVREAVKALQGLGLVTATPFAGFAVAGTSLRDFDEVAELRLVLEPLGVRLATPHLSPADLEVLRGQVERMEALLTAGDISGFARVDAQFHQYLYDRCPNRRLAEILTSLRTAAERNTVLFRRLPDHVAKSQDEHRALLAALMNHDAAAAEAAARRHRCGVTARLRSALSGEGGGAPD